MTTQLINEWLTKNIVNGFWYQDQQYFLELASGHRMPLSDKDFNVCKAAGVPFIGGMVRVK